MIERYFYKSLNDELSKRGFFIATDHAPENCIGICGINGSEIRCDYIRNLQKNYRFAAIKNIIFTIGQNECAGGFYEVLVGSQTKEPYPMIYITLLHDGRFYKMAYSCERIIDFVHRDNNGNCATEYILECVRFITGRLMDIVQEWILEGKFPSHRFADGSDKLII